MLSTKHRLILIAAFLLMSLFYVYPSIGWMTLSQEERQERLDRWTEEDKARLLDKPGYWARNWNALQRWAEFDRNKVINLGLDLQGGVHMVIGLDMDAVDPSIIEQQLANGWSYDGLVEHYQEIALQTIERRVSEFEAKEPLIQKYGDRQIQIQLPGEQRVDRAIGIIKKTAFLTFQLVDGRDVTDRILREIETRHPRELVPFLKDPFETDLYRVPAENVEVVRALITKANEEEWLKEEGKVVSLSRKPEPEDGMYRIYVLDREPLMTGEGLKEAFASQDLESLQGGFRIAFTLDAASGERFAEVTEQNMGRNMAIVVDGIVESAPTIRGRIYTSGEITGNFTGEEAQDLAIALSSGSMPVPITEEFTGIVGASLGRQSIRKGITSSLIGLLTVIIFLVIFYRRAGVAALVSLVYNAVLILAAMAYFNATLTLPGIAGLILTIGMAVDANVLIYERMREEMRNGRSILASIDSGFKRASITILDANVTTLIAAIVLLQFGTGPIEGFAIALSIGVVTSVFSALIVCRAVFDFMSERSLLGNLSMMQLVKDETQIGFMSARRMCFIFSAIAILISITAFTYRSVGTKDMYGVDFTTGTSMIVSLDHSERITVEQVRRELERGGFKTAQVQLFEQSEEDFNRFFLRLTGDMPEAPAALVQPAGEDAATTAEAPSVAEASNASMTILISDQVKAALSVLTTDPANPEAVVVEREETVGPAVGEQLKKDALLSILMSLVFIVMYLWFRFEWKFAVGAVVALVHDVSIVVGLFALLPWLQITLPVVAAILTVIGYSLNDTIVVFDRIREDMRAYRGRGMSLLELMNYSINETLSRTLLTSMTTLFVLIVLFFFGGPDIKDFAFALIAGIVVGTYSSIFVASPVIHLLDRYVVNRFKKDEAEGNTSRKRKPKSGKGKEIPAS